MEEEKKSDCVKVAVRLRPLSTKEVGNNESSIIELVEQTTSGSETGSVVINDPENKEKPSTFAFDLVFGTETLQETVFEAIGRAAVNSTLTGYNGTIFAYGQTGSGKSWCMMGGNGDLKGIIPRVNEELFAQIDEQQATSSRQFLVMCSFFEIYNEIIFDLFNPVQDRSKLGAGLQVKEHPVLGIYVKDLQEIVVGDAEKLVQLMHSGTKNRAVSSTLMNSVSSRSHSIFTIKVHQKDDQDKSKNVFAKLNLVDLAGSERQKGTGASGQTLKEGANINKSLSALGNVINALVEIANGKKTFVPFRNSKLTRVLQESLGGNSLCTMLATLSPAASNYEETMSTLRYANRAKAIKVSATKNEEASQISRLNSEIDELKKKLATAQEGGEVRLGLGDASEERKAMQEKLQGQLADMQKMVSSTWEDKAKLSADYESQIGKVLNEQKKQTKAMQEECRKRLRLLEDQNDLELSIRGLMDTLQSLPAEIRSGTPLPTLSEKLCSCELPQHWLKLVAEIVGILDSCKKDCAMVVAFQSAFREDLRLWVDGEGGDFSMARTGARRALTKLETLKREVGKIHDLEATGRSKVQDFTKAVREAHEEWLQQGADAVKCEMKEETPDTGDASPIVDQSGLSPLYAQVLKDIDSILILIQNQARIKVDDFTALSGEAQPLAELMIHGLGLIGLTGQQNTAAEEELIRSFLVPSDGHEANETKETSKAPRESRPIQEWSAEDVDDSPEGTEFVLKQVISLDTLNKKRTALELLARPPPKFVHDVAILIQQKTGFMQAMSHEWPEQSRDARVDLLQYIADSTGSCLAVRVDFDPSDVLKGKEVGKTLRLLQLLALAAVKFVNPGRNGLTDSPPAKLQRKTSKTRLGDMSPFLDALSRCLRAVVELHAQGDGPSPSREDPAYRALQDRLQAEQQMRNLAAGKRNEERLLQLQSESQNLAQLLAQRQEQLEKVSRAAVETAERKAKLQMEVDTGRQKLLEKASTLRNPKVEQLKAEIGDVMTSSEAQKKEKVSLQSQLQEMTQEQIEAETRQETLEMEMERMQVSVAEAQGSSSEEVLVMQAEHEKLRLKIASLEERMRQVSEEEDMERELETQLQDEKKLFFRRSQDLQMQLQVILEERDGLREGMDLLWQEKTLLEEELENVSEGYNHLSNRLIEKIEEAQELQDQMQQYENLYVMLTELQKQKMEKEMKEKKHQTKSPKKVNQSQEASPASPSPVSPGADESGSSHYSDDAFEDPEED